MGATTTRLMESSVWAGEEAEQINNERIIAVIMFVFIIFSFENEVDCRMRKLFAHKVLWKKIPEKCLKNAIFAPFGD